MHVHCKTISPASAGTPVPRGNEPGLGTGRSDCTIPHRRAAKTSKLIAAVAHGIHLRVVVAQRVDHRLYL